MRRCTQSWIVEFVKWNPWHKKLRLICQLVPKSSKYLLDQIENFILFKSHLIHHKIFLFLIWVAHSFLRFCKLKVIQLWFFGFWTKTIIFHNLFMCLSNFSVNLAQQLTYLFQDQPAYSLQPYGDPAKKTSTPQPIFPVSYQIRSLFTIRHLKPLFHSFCWAASWFHDRWKRLRLRRWFVHVQF